MASLYLKIPFFALCLLAAEVSSQSNRIAEPFKIALGNHSPPWNWVDNNQQKGILIDIINEALIVRMKLKVEIYNSPWKRAQQTVKYNRADALITNYIVERKTYTTASTQYITNIRRMMFINKNTLLKDRLAKVQSLDDLKSFSIGSYLGNPWAERTFKDYKITWAPNVSLSLKMLDKSRFSVFVGNSVSTNYKLKELNLKNVVMLPTLLNDIKASRYQLLINNNSNYLHILAEFDQTIITMKKDGSLQAIFDKYK